MNLRFQKSPELLEALNRLSQLGDSAILNVQQDAVQLVVGEVCTGVLYLPSDFFANFRSLNDSYSLSMRMLINHVASQPGIASFEGLEMNLVGGRIVRDFEAPRIKVSSIELQAEVSHAVEDPVIEIRGALYVNGKKLSEPVSLQPLRVRIALRPFQLAVCDISRYCELMFAPGKLKIEYPLMGFKLFYIIG